MMKLSKPLEQYKLIIFDMDGTLYYQLPLRLHMALSLMAYYFIRPYKWRELLILKKYRQVREHFQNAESASIEDTIYNETAALTHTSPVIVRKIIKKWIYDKPLFKLPLYKDHTAAGFMQSLRNKYILTVVYSDYPVKDKLNVLDIHPDYYFSGDNININCLKPNPKGIRYIINLFGILPEDILIVGDRMEKDGKAADSIGSDYLILSKFKHCRKKQYKAIRVDF